MARGESSGTETQAGDEQRIHRPAKAARGRLVAIGVRHYGVIDREQHLAHVAAAHEQAGSVIRCSNAWKRLQRAQQIALGAGRPIRVDRLPRKHRVDQRARPDGAHRDPIFQWSNLEDDIKQPVVACGYRALVWLEAGHRDAKPRPGTRHADNVEGAPLVAHRDDPPVQLDRRARQRQASGVPHRPGKARLTQVLE